MNEEKIIARPLVTITNVIWSFNPDQHHPQVLLIKRAASPYDGWWALPETLLRSDESAEAACIRLIEDKIGIQVPLQATEQLATFTDPQRVNGNRALALAYMTFLPTMLPLQPGNGASDAQWFTLQEKKHVPVLVSRDQVLTLNLPNQLAFDHAKIMRTSLLRIKNKLDYQPGILRILGSSFTLRQAREVYAAFLGIAVDQIDNSNFKKTHAQLFTEVGTAVTKHSGRPPKLYRLK